MKKLILTTFLIAIAFYSCSDDTSTEVEKKSISISNNTTYGKILTDKDGMSLYFFSKDSKGVSECNGGCLDNWPIYYDANLTLDANLNYADFGIITRADGKMQNTYKGWPLYYFANDTNAGDVKGENVNNIWFVAKPDYSLMFVSAQLVGNDGKNYLSNYTEGTGATKYLTDINGRTLYGFKNDKKSTNKFTKADFSNNGVWPIAEITLDKVPSNFNITDFGEIDVFGKKQLTYKGWPLYYFGADTNRGDNKGISFPSPGVWPIINTDTPEAPLP